MIKLNNTVNGKLYKIVCVSGRRLAAFAPKPIRNVGDLKYKYGYCYGCVLLHEDPLYQEII